MACGPTHVPGADEDGDHVGLRLLGVLVLHLLEKLAEAFSLLGIEGQTDSDRPLPPCTCYFQRTGQLRENRGERRSVWTSRRAIWKYVSEVLRERLLSDPALPLQGPD